MRATFASRLAGIEHRACGRLGFAAATLARIGDAITDPTAERVRTIGEYGGRLRQASRIVAGELVALTACQTAVAGDLRLVLALIQLAHHERLIANQFELIGEQLMEINPAVLDRQRTEAKLFSMTTLASALLQSGGRVRGAGPRSGAARLTATTMRSTGSIVRFSRPRSLSSRLLSAANWRCGTS